MKGRGLHGREGRWVRAQIRWCLSDHSLECHQDALTSLNKEEPSRAAKPLVVLSVQTCADMPVTTRADINDTDWDPAYSISSLPSPARVDYRPFATLTNFKSVTSWSQRGSSSRHARGCEADRLFQPQFSL